MSHRLPLRTFLSACLVASVVTPVAARSAPAPATMTRTTHAATPTSRGDVSRTRLPDGARTARLRAAFGHLPLSFERNIGQADRRVAFAARGAGYALYVSRQGATLVLAAPPMAARPLPHPNAARLPRLPAHARGGALIAAPPITPTLALTTTPTVTATATDTPGSPVTTLTATATASASPPATLATLTATIGMTPAATTVLSVTATVGVTPAATAPVTDTTGLTPLPTPPGKHARPTIPPGAGTVIPTRTPPPSIVRPTPGISQTLVLTPTGLVQAMALHFQHHGHAHGKDKRHAAGGSSAVVQLTFAGANPNAQVVGLDALPGTANYLLGATRQQWQTKAPTYARVAYRGLYPGIDLAFHGQQGTLEYDWLLAPHAAPGRIRLAVHGAGRLHLDRQGDLLLDTAAGTLRQARPVAYQQIGGQRRLVTARYSLRAGHEVGLAVGAYDQSRPLVIDPVLSYATYLGGSDVDQGTGIAVDGSGYVYVTGDTFSSNFPTVNPEQGMFAGGTQYGDAFITKLTPDGSSIVYSTYLGGSADEDVWKIAVDSAGEAVVAGYTASTNFPLANAAQSTYGGGPYDGFVSKLSADGSSLVYSTYLGGSGDDEGYGVALDGAGNAYVTGLTSSPNFPTTANAAQSSFGGYYDAFVTELSPSGSLVYSTYLGGSSDDDGYAIAVDGAGNAYVAGATASSDFPVSTNAYQPYFVGGCSKNSCTYDAFVAKISAGGTSIAYGTYLGGSGDDMAEGIAVDGNGNAWVTGNTASADFPTVNAPQSTFGGGAYDAFVAEVTPDGSGLAYSTYLGGSGDDEAYALALDTSGDVYVAGETASTNFPTVNAAQSTFGGGPYDAFVAELGAAGGGTIYATYLGGSGDDAAFGLAIGPDGSADVAGLTSSTDFPVTNAVQSAYNSGTYDAFVAGLAAAPAGVTCPDSWSCDDIGSPPLAGDQTLSNGTWTIRGSGSDIFNASDQFHYVSQQVSGDSSIVARLVTQQNTSICTKAGIMYRASTDAGAVNYSVVMLPDCHYSTSSVQVNYRDTSGNTSATANDVLFNTPIYLKATRTGTTFTAYTSTDGTTWTPIANSAVSLPNMPTNAMVGLVVCSQNSATTSQATFDNVRLSGAVDLTSQDISTEHYTQTIDGASDTTNLQLYGGPAASPDDMGWHPINLTLTAPAGTGVISPTLIPFGLQLAPTSGSPTLATLTAEDGITLGLGLAAPTAGVTGQVSGNTVTYPGIVPSAGATAGSDLALRATGSGLDARLVLHSASEGGPFGVALASSLGTGVMQDGTGAIRVTQAITQYGDDGVGFNVITQTEAVMQPPVLTDSSADPAAPVNTGPATATVAQGSAGSQIVTVSIDPTWLHAPGRVFPVNLDLPILTANAELRSGAFGTVNSCAPDTSAPPTALVVGAENGCTYNGQAYFDLSSISANLPSVVSATLRLYTPNQTGPTAVQVEANAAGVNDPSQPTTWTGAPAVVTGTAPIAQSGSDRHWQSWDVTSIVQGWVQDGTTNGGLTLVNAGTPVRFASSLGAGFDDPSATPYLDITYGPSVAGTTNAVTTNAVTTNAVTPASTSPGPYNFDGQPYIYGTSGSYTADFPTGTGNASIPDQQGQQQTRYPCTSNGVTCGQGAFRISASHYNLQAQYIRFGVNLACPDYQQTAGISPTAPGQAWWQSDPSDPAGKGVVIGPNNQPITVSVYADAFDLGNIAQMLASAQAYHIVPILDIIVPDCHYAHELTPVLWYKQVRDLVQYLHNDTSFPTTSMIYFEVGNEPDLDLKNIAKYTDGTTFISKDGTYHYESVYAYAARGLYQSLSGYGYSRYRILTAGMSVPTATTKAGTTCLGEGGPTFNQYDSVFAAAAAISATIHSSAQVVVDGMSIPPAPAGRLGLAVHPYGYDTPDDHGHWWKNFYKQLPLGSTKRFSYNACLNLSDMINTWTTSGTHRGIPKSRYYRTKYSFASLRLPVIFTEDNYSPGEGLNGIATTNAPAQGAYTADLFTWLNDRYCTRKNGVCVGLDPTRAPVRVAYFRGVDAPGDNVGIYSGVAQAGYTNGAPKVATVYCPDQKRKGISNTPVPIARIYSSLIATACYR